MEEIHISGGLDFDGTETNCLRVAKILRRYTVTKGEWETLKPLPVPRYMHVSLLVGGYEAWDKDKVRTISILAVVAHLNPLERGAFFVELHPALNSSSSNRAVFVIGGCDVGASSPPHASVTPSNEIFRFNNCTWRRLRSMANRRCFFGAVAMEDRYIYVFGGQGAFVL